MRSEEDVVTQAPLEVVLGGVKYEIEPLKIREARKWRKQLADIKDALADLPSEVENVGELISLIPALVGHLFVTIPDRIIDLVFSYAPTLPRDLIEDTATDAEIITAFVEILKVAFPFGKALGSITRPGGLLEALAPGSSTEASTS